MNPIYEMLKDFYENSILNNCKNSHIQSLIERVEQFINKNPIHKEEGSKHILKLKNAISLNAHALLKLKESSPDLSPIDCVRLEDENKLKIFILNDEAGRADARGRTALSVAKLLKKDKFIALLS